MSLSSAMMTGFTGIKSNTVAVDTVGSIAAVERSLETLRRGAHLVSAGFYGVQDRLALQPLRARELVLDMVSGWTVPRMDQTLALIAGGQLETLPLITHHFPVDRAAQAWELIAGKQDSVLGVILDW